MPPRVIHGWGGTPLRMKCMNGCSPSCLCVQFTSSIGYCHWVALINQCINHTAACMHEWIQYRLGSTVNRFRVPFQLPPCNYPIDDVFGWSRCADCISVSILIIHKAWDCGYLLNVVPSSSSRMKYVETFGQAHVKECGWKWLYFDLE